MVTLCLLLWNALVTFNYMQRGNRNIIKINYSLKILMTFYLLNKINALKHLSILFGMHAYIITMGELEYVEAIFAYREHESIEKL